MANQKKKKRMCKRKYVCVGVRTQREQIETKMMVKESDSHLNGCTKLVFVVCMLIFTERKKNNLKWII